VCDPAICCKQNKRADDYSGISNPNQGQVPLVSSSLLQTDANVPQKISPAANNQEPAVSAEGDTNPARILSVPAKDRSPPK